MEVLIVLAIAALAAVILIPLAVAWSLKTNAAWAQAASSLGLLFQPPRLFRPRRIGGVLDGHAVSVDTFTRSSGKHSTTYTRYRLEYPQPLGLGLTITRPGILAALTRLLGARDIDVGDPEFDREALVKGRSPERIVAFLTPPRQLRIRRALVVFPGLKITDRGLEWEKVGVDRDPRQIAVRVRQLARLASSLGAEPGGGGRLGQAVEARPPGPTGESGEAGPGTRESTGADGAGERRLRARPEAAAETPSAGPPGVRAGAWSPQTARLAGGAGQQLPEPFPAEGAEAAPIDRGQAAACEDLFGGGNRSLEAARVFEARHAGRQVVWSGRLARVESYSYDYVFGRGPGARALVEVHQLRDRQWGDGKVRALVQLPAREVEALSGRVGEEVTFEGRLLEADGLLRNLYVAAGRIRSAMQGDSSR